MSSEQNYLDNFSYFCRYGFFCWMAQLRSTKEPRGLSFRLLIQHLIKSVSMFQMYSRGPILPGSWCLVPGFDGNSLVYVIFPQRINPDSFIDTFVPTAIIGFVCLDDSFRILSASRGHWKVIHSRVLITKSFDIYDYS